MFKNIWDNKEIRQISYFILTAVCIFCLWFLAQKVFNFGHLLDAYELKAYDLRANMAVENSEPNHDIVILSIDDTSLEVLQEDLGRWPWSRDVYAKAIRYMEQDNVDSIAFDLMFVGHQKGHEDKDKILTDTINEFNNVYVSMNFDYRDNQDNPIELPDKYAVEVENNSKNIDYSEFTYTYPRLILDEIIQGTDKVGFINFRRDPIDKISRRNPTFFKYNDKFYPYLSLKVASDYLKNQEKLDFNKFIITENNDLIVGNRTLPLDETGSMIINWYGANGTYEHIPFWKVYKSAQNIKNGEPPVLPEGYFKDKIVFVGATAVSLYDIKSTPLSSVYPGVEVHATVVNNVLDNQTIKRVHPYTDILISLILGFLVAMAVIKIREPIISTLISFIVVLAYVFAASYLLDHYHVWVGISGQLAFIAATFTIMFIIKYVLKSKDFEYTYKLATTDGLTGLYNHRYFQEKIREKREKMEKSGKESDNFSIILIDIDFFKKFNDTYGHQAGDEVLRQTATTLKKAVKSSDLVARYGGEEMVIILSKASKDEALMIADRVCKAMAAQPFKLADGLEVHVTISLGIATYPMHGKTAVELIEFADRGLYNAKENGRNQVGPLPDIAEINEIKK